MIKRAITGFAVTLLVCQVSYAQLIGYFSEGGGAMTVETTDGPIQTAGLNFIAEPGILTKGEDAAPFDFFLGTDPDNITFAALRQVTLDGIVELDMQVAPEATPFDIQASYGDGTSPRRFPIQGIVSSPLAVTIPGGGGPVTISPSDQSAWTVGRLALQATQGLIEAGGSPAPFETLIENTTTRWEASTSAGVTIDGSVQLDVVASYDATVNVETYSADNQLVGSSNLIVGERLPGFGNALTARHDNLNGGPIVIQSRGGPVNLLGLELASANSGLSSSGDPSPFETLESNTSNLWKASSSTDVQIDGVLVLDVITEPEQNVTGVYFEGIVARRFLVRDVFPLDRITLSHPIDGGPLTLDVDGSFLNGINLTATQGTFTGGGDASPFSVLSSNTPERWAAESQENIFVDGQITLDVTVSSGAVISGTIQNDVASAEISITQSEPVVAIYPREGGPITLEFLDGPRGLMGVEFLAEPGVLTQGASAEPFDFFIPDSAAPGNVTLGVLGTPVTLDGSVELDVIVAPDTPFGEISANWDNGANQFGLFVVPTSRPTPEPSSNITICMGLIGLLLIRRQQQQITDRGIRL